MKLTKFSFIILVLFSCTTIFAQTEKKNDNGNNFNGVTISYLSQRCLPPDKVPYISPSGDFIDSSDMIVRFRIENNGKQDIYYLAASVFNSISPVGYRLSRKSKAEEWGGIYSLGRGRERDYTGSSYHWVSLPPTMAVEFESTDLSSEEGEHATSVFFNTEAQHKNRVEVISNTFVPVQCPKSKK